MTPSPLLNWESLADFQLGDFPNASNHPNVSFGYDIAATKISADRRNRALSRANGILSGLNPPTQRRVRFFVNEVEISIGLSGTYAQGHRVRDFYPHNLVMPTYRVTAQTLNQEDYGLVCEFIHATHQVAVGNGVETQLDILGGGLIKYESETLHRNASWMKGVHKPITVTGFVGSITREHKKGNYAPIFTFEFNVVHSHQGIFEGNTAYENPQIGFNEIIEKQERPFSQAPKTSKH